MILDIFTLQVANALVVVACSVGFILNTLMRSYNASGIYLSVAFLTGLFSSIAFAIAALHPEMWPPVAVGNSLFILSCGSVWAGLRSFSSAPARFVIVVVAALVAAVWVPLQWEQYGTWSGSEAFLLGIALFLFLAGYHALRTLSKHSLHARITGITVLLVSAYFVARFIAMLVLGRENMGLHPFLGTITATSIVTIMLVMCSVSLSALRAEREVLLRRDLEAGPYSDTFALGALDSATFDRGGADRMERGAAHGVRVALLHTRLEGLGEYNIVYGRSAGDEAIVRYARVLRASVPPTALIGHRGGGSFAVLAMLDVVTTARDVATAVIDALSDEPLDDAEILRFGVSVGIAEPLEGSLDWENLVERSDVALEKAQLIGANAIVEWSAADSISLRHGDGHTLDA